MGMYTYISDSDVNIIDKDGLLDYIKKLNNDEFAYKDLQIVKDYCSKLKILDNNTLDFNGWDGFKIISYWYDSMVQLLHDLALFVEGEVLLDFENQDEGGWIEFSNFECIIHVGQMQWSEQAPHDFANIEDIEWIRQVKIAKKI